MPKSCRQYVSGKEDVSLWLLNWVTIMLNNVIISVIQVKSIATIREKRKRYRKKKKDKFHANHIPISEEGSAQCHLDSGIEYHEGTLSKSNSCRSSSSLSDFRWREVNEKAAMIRQEQAEKEEELKRKYGAYVDSETYLLNSEMPKIPDSLSGVQRVEVLTLVKELCKRENKAISNAHLYRDECTQLKHRCRELEEEKEGIRYFWRNKVMEGQSRSGMLVKLAVNGLKV